MEDASFGQIQPLELFRKPAAHDWKRVRSSVMHPIQRMPLICVQFLGVKQYGDNTGMTEALQIAQGFGALD